MMERGEEVLMNRRQPYMRLSSVVVVLWGTEGKSIIDLLSTVEREGNTCATKFPKRLFVIWCNLNAIN